jgi:hypothetical protein
MAKKKVLRDHLFNSHTNKCLFCNIENEDALMESGPCSVATNENIKRAPLYEGDN